MDEPTTDINMFFDTIRTKFGFIADCDCNRYCISSLSTDTLICSGVRKLSCGILDFTNWSPCLTTNFDKIIGTFRKTSELFLFSSSRNVSVDDVSISTCFRIDDFEHSSYKAARKNTSSEFIVSGGAVFGYSSSRNSRRRLNVIKYFTIINY
uniref:Uncharacterized protein n=1 Tax=Oryctes rhinoceros nudivirus TaxID=92521 RepID=A3QTZ8_9VIRU|nr:unknown [Oryctes rhinoceros nudivirus]